MIGPTFDRADLRSCLVCESGTRWLGGLRQFLPPMMPQPLAATVQPTIASQLPGELRGQERAIVWWEVARSEIVLRLDQISAISRASPWALQVVGFTAERLSHREQMALSEVGAATFVTDLEQIPRLAPMISAYFNVQATSQRAAKI